MQKVLVFIPVVIISIISLYIVVLCTGTSLAETPSPVTAESVVEVHFASNEGAPKRTIVEPRLPRRQGVFRSIERQYYTELYSIASEMCTQTPAITYIGFSSELAQYDRVRAQLNRVLTKFKLGLAPSIEDFSNDAGLEFFRYPHPVRHPSKGPYLEEAGSWEFEPSNNAGTNDCNFRIINPPSLQMK